MCKEIAIEFDGLNYVGFDVDTNLNESPRKTLSIFECIRGIVAPHPFVGEIFRFDATHLGKLIGRKSYSPRCNRIFEMTHKLLTPKIHIIAYIDNSLAHTLYSLRNQLLVVGRYCAHELLYVGLIQQCAMQDRTIIIAIIGIARKFLPLKYQIIAT